MKGLLVILWHLFVFGTGVIIGIIMESNAEEIKDE